MADGFTSEQLAQLAGIIQNGIQAALAPTIPTATPAPVASETPLAFDADSSKGKRREVTAEQLAADLVDPERNEYTPLARKYDFALYEPIWRKERERLLAAGVPKSAAGKQAQANYIARLKIEKARLAARDGISRQTMAPTISAESRRSNGTHSDPTANIAIGNVAREEKLAKLRAELAALESESEALSLPVKERKAASARSIAQRAVNANPFQRSVDKLARDAKASNNAPKFIGDWYTENVKESPARKAIIARTAVEACKVLGIPVKG